MQIHTVQKADTLWKIEKMYGVDVDDQKAANPQSSNSDMIMPGMNIMIPGGQDTRLYHVVKQGDTIRTFVGIYSKSIRKSPQTVV